MRPAMSSATQPRASRRGGRARSRWRTVGVGAGWRSTLTIAVLALLGLAWIGWPVWDSLTHPSREQLRAEAPWVLGALVCGLALLAATIWRDAGRRHDVLAPVAGLVLANCVLRAVLSPSSSGVELVHVLPLLAGVALGAPAGFLTGAASGLVSTVLVAVPAETLPSQAVVWGLVGLSGGLLVRLRPTAAWLAALPVALAAGVGSGVLLNLMGWAQETGSSTSHFHPGLPPSQVLERLWAYTLDTSIALDLTRGVTTAVVLLLVGRPLIVALRPTPGDLRVTTTQQTDQVRPAALERRGDRARLDRLWNEGTR